MKLLEGKFQPRKIFNKENLDELKQFYKRKRGCSANNCKKIKKNLMDKYEIVAGERRWLASQNAGLNEIPAVVIEADDIKALEFAIVENVPKKRS